MALQCGQPGDDDHGDDDHGDDDHGDDDHGHDHVDDNGCTCINGTTLRPSTFPNSDSNYDLLTLIYILKYSIQIGKVLNCCHCHPTQSLNLYQS